MKRQQPLRPHWHERATRAEIDEVEAIDNLIANLRSRRESIINRSKCAPGSGLPIIRNEGRTANLRPEIIPSPRAFGRRCEERLHGLCGVLGCPVPVPLTVRHHWHFHFTCIAVKSTLVAGASIVRAAFSLTKTRMISRIWIKSVSFGMHL